MDEDLRDIGYFFWVSICVGACFPRFFEQAVLEVLKLFILAINDQGCAVNLFDQLLLPRRVLLSYKSCKCLRKESKVGVAMENIDALANVKTHNEVEKIMRQNR